MNSAFDQAATDAARGVRAELWTVDLLGPLEVRCSGRHIELPLRRRSLLALLALRSGTMVTADGLSEALWGEGVPRTALRTLHSHIAKLGSALSGTGCTRLIRRRDPGYLLRPDVVRVDQDRFEELSGNARRLSAQGRFAEAAKTFGGALGLWRGEAISDCQVFGWALAEVGYLQELRLQAYEGFFAARMAAGLKDNDVGELERLVARYPLRERLWELLISALQTSGRTGDALIAYQRARRGLLDELGLDPGAGLRQVEAGVLQGIADPRVLLRLTR
ncbi:hypothetical protein GCM10027589_24490 [Actinocorallia lasiicapitis]